MKQLAKEKFSFKIFRDSRSTRFLRLIDFVQRLPKKAIRSLLRLQRILNYVVFAPCSLKHFAQQCSLARERNLILAIDFSVHVTP